MTVEVMGAQALEKVIVGGDLSGLSPSDRMLYYTTLCNSLGLNSLTKPFDYIVLNGKLTLYAKRDCTDQLRKINGVSIAITSRETEGDCYTVAARAIDRTGRTDESTGVVAISNLKGEARSNAMMKAETKAKRRVTLSICGLGILDETEASSLLDSPMNTMKIENTINNVYEVKKFLAGGKISDAYSYCESLPADVKKEVWNRLDADERLLLKEHKEGL